MPAAPIEPGTPASPLRPGLVVGLLVAVLLVLGPATPAAAQGAPAAEERETIDRCIAEGIAEGRAPLTATRSCVDQPDELDRCVEQADAELPLQRAVDRCLDALLADGRIAYPGGTTPEATTTADETTTTADEPGPGPTTEAVAVEEPGGVTGTIAETPEVPVASGSSGSDGLGTPAVLGIALAALVAGGIGGAALGRRGTGPDPGAPVVPAPVPIPPTVPPTAIAAPVAVPVVAPVAAPAADELDGDDAEERRELVRALVEVGDLVTSDALRTHVAERLEAAGVLPVLVAPGTRFDPTAHRGVQAQEAPSPEQDGTVASCDRAGWSDRGELLRPPEVVVYRWGAS